MTDKQIAQYCDDVKLTALKQFRTIQNQRKELALLNKKCNHQKTEIDELTYKLECLLCHATGSKLSKSTYTLKTMESAVNDEVQECCEEAKAEAFKEFADLAIKMIRKNVTPIPQQKYLVESCIQEINNLVKEKE